ncbi:hypothetical protein E3N88_22581 [Mikania micrantha]|uniref:Uncharacterized protein n=1 Tax=Mikania micrantha TaxID=192012 RepID=A0A5N6NCK7_9ASTR|nr:hypothetical protein E3N88_22581 [Mikania micrantha]
MDHQETHLNQQTQKRISCMCIKGACMCDLTHACVCNGEFKLQGVCDYLLELLEHQDDDGIELEGFKMPLESLVRGLGSRTKRWWWWRMFFKVTKLHNDPQWLPIVKEGCSRASGTRNVEEFGIQTLALPVAYRYRTSCWAIAWVFLFHLVFTFPREFRSSSRILSHFHYRYLAEFELLSFPVHDLHRFLNEVQLFVYLYLFKRNDKCFIG